MRVLLVNPYNVGALGLQNILQVEPLGLEVIGAALAPVHDVRILDLRWEPNYESVLRSWKPDLIGISCLYTSHTGATWDLAKRAKTALPSVPVVVGGQPTTLAPEFFASPHIEAIVLYDGEDTMPDLCRAIEQRKPWDSVAGLVLNERNGQRRTAPRMRAETLDDSPRPKRNLPGLTPAKYYFSLERPTSLVEVSRGCPFSCNFCSIWVFGESKVRMRQIDRMVEEIAETPASGVFIVDDHFFVNIKHMEELGRAVARAKLGKHFKIQSRTDAIARNPQLVEVWKEAGLRVVFFGIEGHSDARLDEVHKESSTATNERAVEILKENGIGVVANLMVDANFSRQDFDRMRAYVQEKDWAFASYAIATPFPGTQMWKSRKDEVTTLDFELYDIQHAVMKTRLPLKEFYDEYTKCWEMREAMQPKARTWHTIKRTAQIVLRGDLNLELLRNAKRFDRLVKDADFIHSGHAAPAPTPWVQESSRRLAGTMPA